MSLDVREPVATSLLSWPYWAAAVAFLCYPVFAVRLALRGGQAGVAGWALAFPWLMFIPELSTVRIQEPFVLYRAYLWFPVFSVVVPLAVARVSPRLAVLAISVVVCTFVPLAWNRLASLSDSLTAWNDAAKRLVRGDEPGAGRIYYNRALALAKEGREEEALRDVERAAMLHPRFAPIRFTQAKMLFNLKRYGEALDALNKAIDLDSGRDAYYFARAITLKRLGREDEAQSDMRKGCSLGNVVACTALESRGKVRK
jgi:uncharacterized protein HemY